MAALTSQSITVAGVVPSAVAVSASDTIAQSQFGPNGVLIRVINGGGSPDTVTITDPGTTASGSAATNPTVSVAAGAAKLIRIAPTFLDSTGKVTVGHSFTTSVTCEVWAV